MNGRLYDPKLHRFLQPDNYVQDPSNTQNYNRYSYVLNNPLKYTDPSGEKWKITWSDIVSAVAIVAGTVLSFTGFAIIGVPLAAAGIAHFTTALNEFKQKGDWVSASNNAGFIVSYSQRVDWLDGSTKTDVNGVNQSAPAVTPKSDTSSGGGKEKTNSNDSVYNFYGAKVFIMSENGSSNWSLFGVIHTSRAFYDGYQTNGINSYEGLLLMHEYGHYLHSQYSPLNFYSYAMWSSMGTASSATASSNWTEIKANTMSYYYFHYPQIYNHYKQDYPIDTNSISNELKYKLYHHLKL